MTMMKPSVSSSIRAACRVLAAASFIVMLALAAPVVAATPSPSGTIITPGKGSITDSSGNVYVITAAGAIQKNGNALPGGGGTGEIEYYNSVVYFQDASSHTWYTWNGTYFVGSTGPTSDPLPGICGPSNGASFTNAPKTGLCTAGIASAIAGNGPWMWNCFGSNGGAMAQCSALKLAPINGACGPSNGTSFTSAPTTGLCSAGTPSAVSGTGPWNWSCAGSNGGTTAQCAAPPSVAAAPLIWFTPHWGTAALASNYIDLLGPTSAWQDIASQVDIISLSAILISQTPDAVLQGIFQGLQARHIALGVQMEPLPGGPNGCGYGVESYGAPASTLALARKIKSLGGTVAYYGLDEPLYFGHVFTQQGAKIGCQYSIDQIAGFVADRLREVRSVFPNVQFAEAEPLMGFDDSTWQVDFEHWLDAYEAATGEPLGNLRVDNTWSAPWRARLPQLASILDRKGVGLGMIYNGGRSYSDDEWSPMQ